MAVQEETEEPAVGEDILVRVSHYNPSLGGVNCATFYNGTCISKMSNGEPWQDWIDKAIACPFEIPFEAKIIINGREWICKDRGSAITYDGYAYWVDQLTTTPEYRFGEILEAKMILP